MRRRLLLALIALSGCGSDTEPPTGPITYDVLRYDYSIDLATRAATARVTFDVVEPGDCMTIGFRATALADVTFDDEPIDSGGLDGDALTACGVGWEAGTQVVLGATLTVPDETWGDSQVGYSVSQDLEGGDFTYMVGWVGGCDRFGPCDGTPSAFARYRLEVTHPPGTQVLCPGVVDAGDTTTVCDFDYDGGPTYSTFALAADANWQETDLGDWDGVHVTLYDQPSTGTAARIDSDMHAQYLAWMADLFGPYPYGDELRLATGPTYWAGFEHPGNILLDDRLAAGLSRYPLNHTVNHELTHMWAGDETTLADTYDFTWKEAMAEYLSFVFEDEQIGEATALSTARSWRSGAASAEFYPVPGEKPALLDYYGDVYGAGPMVLFRQLEALYDRDTVLSALQLLLGEQRAIGVADVKAALEQTTGADLTGYFDKWVYGTGAPTWPHVNVAVADNGDGTVTVTVDQVAQGDGYYGMAFFVRLTGDNDGEEQDVWIDFGVDGSPSASATVTPGFVVTGHTVDPLAHSLAQENGAAARAADDAVGTEFRLPWGFGPR